MGQKLGVGSPNFGRKVVNSVKTVNSTLQKLAPLAGLIAPSLAPAIAGGLALSQATTSAVQSASQLAKSTRAGGDNSNDLAKFAGDYQAAKSGYSQMRKNGLEKVEPVALQPQLQFS